jgi:Uma2 family endonuclease
MLSGVFGADRIQVQLPVRLPEPEGQYSEPEPDVVLFSGTIRDFLDRHPAASDIALAIEVSDTNFHMNRAIKFRLYARSGIPEYWIADIPERRMFVCRDPSGDEYRTVTVFGEDQQLSLPGTRFVLSFNDLLPKR